MSFPSLPKLKVTPSPVSVKPVPKKAKISYNSDDDEDAPAPKKAVSKETSASFTSLLKASLKDKVEKKLQEKEPKKVISFPKDKPTYNITLLEG
jgi:hypothetical protein